eukprot:4698472-Ditylum_brightwellii.AAC.1
MIAYVYGHTLPREWGKMTSQKSAPLALTAGKFYYFEGLHIEFGGNDNFAIAWAVPGTSDPVVISDEYFFLYVSKPCASDAECDDGNWCTASTCDLEKGRCNAQVDISETQCPPLDAFCNSIRTCHSNDDGTGFCATVSICDDLNPCSQDTCNATMNSCSYSRIAGCSQEGFFLETWRNINGYNLGNLYASPKFPDSPDSTGTITGLLEIPIDSANSYGSRLSGYITAPATGEYTFWVASDNQGVFFLSSNTKPENMNPIAYVNEWVTPHKFNNNPGTQKSAPVSLVLGESYYFEGHHKEGGGGDHYTIAWSIPGSDPNIPVVIEANHISKYPPMACAQDLDCTDNNNCTINICNSHTKRCNVDNIYVSENQCNPENKFGTKQNGFCMTSDGLDQNSGVYQLASGDFENTEMQTECLLMCASYPGHTGCEAIWNQYNRGCYVHTKEVTH